MDKEKARFILSSFRPDGSDASDPLFTEALQAAAADRDLGQWLATERARDAAFTEALGNAHVPADLRESLLQVFRDSGLTIPQAEEFDAPFIGALATLAPPEILRADILRALEMERGPRRRALPTRRRWIAALATAAALTLGIFLLFGPGTPSALAAITPPEMRAQSLTRLTAPGFNLTARAESLPELIAWLKENSLPLPHHYPEALRKLKTDGVREITLKNGTIPASVLRFESPDATPVYLVIIDRTHLEGDLPFLPDSFENLASTGGWASAQWACPNCAYLLLTPTPAEKAAALL